MAALRPSGPRTTPLLAATVVLWALLFPGMTGASGDRYRVELIVFLNLEVPAAPDEVDRPRRFRGAFELEAGTPPEAPVALDKRDGTFANLWTRLERLDAYEPLVRLSFEQTMFDYHPPVRVHDDVVMARELHVPGAIAYLDLERGGEWFEDYVRALYRLDGTVQLRRSRFLHVDLDLEYRLEGPAWERMFPDPDPARLEDGFEWVGEAPAVNEPRLPPLANLDPEPFRLHRLNQSRQVRTDTLQYFDSAFLGAIVRVTSIADDPR